ncbi:helix-turn-helix domain-containing protein [Agromyces sp. NPDC056965]|uniref:helix-turn-helix domain-containing protein n=1 Tax=Agromyces sp. NPDC056965 TaxID=3345983 RepID=UPI00363B1BF3
MSFRPPEHLVHGLDGAVAILSGRVCSLLNHYAGLEEFRRKVRGQDPHLDAALVAMNVAALQWRRSATGTTREAQPELASESEWLSTTEVAAQLWMTSRGVRKAITDGRLRAETVAGRYRISREALAHYKASRI